MKKMIMILTVAICSLSLLAFGAETMVVGFDGGSDGGFSGNAYFEGTGGHPDGVAHHLGLFFFNELRTGGEGEPANPAFLGDYSSYQTVTFSFDIKTNSLTDWDGNPMVRSIGIALRDRDIMGPDGPSGLFIEVGLVSVDQTGEWTTLSVTIDDPTSETLPAGWMGTGGYDPNTYEPTLPDGATFASVLASVDEFQITGAVPGFWFSDANFDVLIDNVTVIVEEGGVATESTSLDQLKALYR